MMTEGIMMKELKGILIGLLAIVVAVMMTFQPSRAEIYKWVDDKGTVHFTEDPSTIPEKYLEKVKSRSMEGDSTPPRDQIKDKRREEERIRALERSGAQQDRAKESEERGRRGRGEVEMVSWNFSGACATVSIRNSTSVVQEITESNFIAITPKKIVTRYEEPRSRSHTPSIRSPSYNPNPVPAEEKDRFSPRPFLVQLAPGQTQTISICFERDLPGAKLELRGL
jgi:hypothetical protein